jgi:hypothetical protein
MVVGLIFTFLLPETKGKTLEQLSNDEEIPKIVQLEGIDNAILRL